MSKIQDSTMGLTRDMDGLLLASSNTGPNVVMNSQVATRELAVCELSVHCVTKRLSRLCSINPPSCS